MKKIVNKCKSTNVQYNFSDYNNSVFCLSNAQKQKQKRIIFLSPKTKTCNSNNSRISSGGADYCKKQKFFLTCSMVKRLHGFNVMPKTIQLSILTKFIICTFALYFVSYTPMFGGGVPVLFLPIK